MINLKVKLDKYVVYVRKFHLRNFYLIHSQGKFSMIGPSMIDPLFRSIAFLFLKLLPWYLCTVLEYLMLNTLNKGRLGTLTTSQTSNKY
jgi:hypothetical protein